jgi:hypothetical protein
MKKDFIYRLTRLNDGLVKEGTQLAWINYKLTGNSIYKRIAKGRGLVIYRSMGSYWQTTLVQSYKKLEDGTIMFTTENSDYKLEKIKKEK